MKLFLAFAALVFSLQPVTAQAARETLLVFSGGAVRAHCVWQAGPQSPEESVMRIDWKSGDGLSAIEAPGTFKVTPFMPSMGHGSSPTQIERVLDEQGRVVTGSYLVKNIYFTMPGDWEVKVKLKGADGREETQSVRLKL